MLKATIGRARLREFSLPLRRRRHREDGGRLDDVRLGFGEQADASLQWT